MKHRDHLIVLGVVLETAAGIDDAGDAKTVELAHEVARRVELLLERKFWPLRQRRIQDKGTGPRDQQTGGITGLVSLDFAAERIWRVLVISNYSEGGAIQQRPRVEMQHEHRRIRCRGIDFVERRHA